VNGTADTGYTFKEARVLIGPLVGWPPEDVKNFVIVTIDQNGAAGFGASPGIEPQAVPALLRAMADGIEREVTS
jgi:hypothetical protein